MQHLDEGTIHAWLDGELASPEREALEAHIAECAQCAAVVAEARGFIAASTRILTALDSVPGGVLPAASTGSGTGRPAVRRRFVAPRAWMAAAAVLVLSTVTVIAVRPGSDAARLRVAVATREQKELSANAEPSATPNAAASATPTEEKPQAAEPSIANAPAPMQARKAASADEPKAVDQNERLKSRLEAERQLTRPRSNNGAPPVIADAAPRARAAAPSASMGRVSEQPLRLPPAPSAFAKDAAEERTDVVSKSDSTSERRAAANAQGVPITDRVASAAGAPIATSLGGKVGAVVVADSASVDSTPKLLSRNTIHAAGDTVVTTIYSVHGVSVSLTDHSRARDEALRLQVRGAVSEMPAKSQKAAAAVNTISWTDSTGHTRTLRGPLTTEQLTQLRNTLFAPTP